MFIYVVLRSKRNPRAPTTSHRITVPEDYKAPKMLKEYVKTLRSNNLLEATLMETASKPVRTLYKNGIYYY